ncbi:T9SS type A sorting domain-containing protein [Polaribacter vadi]|uniref:T9SS type A sorting domain-containing protein n=1 Tax=Polaribacter vadi TaxID=1774273 RepID=UPI0030EDF639|tara:strand:- start:46438 stop:48348 length:1911 start_codon:yes stop_codon:yes gene_type:complete
MKLIFRNTKTNLLGISRLTIILLLGLNVFVASAQTQKPPLMGWASWNNFRANINESIIKAQTDAMVSSGLINAGYKYINIDDGFFDGRNADGSLRIDAVKFPNGMKFLADYIHDKGLKAGFYSEAGSNTCGSMYDGQTGGAGAGLYGYDQEDIDLIFKTWGYDFIKVDYCGGKELHLDEKTRYTAIKQAMENTGITGIGLNVCRWRFPGAWVTQVADSWRVSDDITPHWNSVINNFNKNAFLSAYSSPGHYNDMDMLQVGRGLTAEEDKSHFSLWCIMSSPLVLGNDLTSITATTKEILTNSEMIAVNQDVTGGQAHRVFDDGAGLQVWAKNMNGKQSKERAVVLFNNSTSAASISVKWADLNLVGPATVRDLWSHTDLGSQDAMYTTIVPSHGVVALKVVGSGAKLQEVFEAEYAWINNFNVYQSRTYPNADEEIIPDQGRASDDGSCSGRAKAVWLGNRADNYIEFRDVFASAAGSYMLTMSYLSGQNRDATISVNGVDTILKNLNSGSFDTLKDITLSVTLNQGYNTIRISNTTGWLPDIDKIQFSNLNILGVKKQNKLDSTINAYPNPIGNTLFFKTKMKGIKVSVISTEGKLVSVQNVKDNKLDVSGLAAGAYFVVFDKEGRKITKRFIKK